MLLQRKHILYILIIFLLFALHDNSYSITRWFKISYGLRLGPSIIDIEDRAPQNNITYTVGFTGGFTADFKLVDRISIGLELLYSLRGGVVPSTGSYINLHYISVPTLVKVWVMRKRFAITLGPVHNFLVYSSGEIPSPHTALSPNNIRLYDLGIAFGASFVITTFENGIKLLGELRFEIGVVDVLKDFRPELFNRNLPYFGIGIDF